MKQSLNSMKTFFIFFILAFASIAYAADQDLTRPTVTATFPGNNAQDLPTNIVIAIVFSEDMNPETINENTITVIQGLTPIDENHTQPLPIAGTIQYYNKTAYFTPDERFKPTQEFGNVFTVTVNTGAMDMANNSISRDYVFSFTTGDDPFYTDENTTQIDQTPVPVNATMDDEPEMNDTNITTPIATPPTTDEEGQFPWVWVAAAAVLILLIILIAASNSAPKKDKQKSKVSSRAFGSVHPVEYIEGIAPTYKRDLKSMGIRNTRQLWETDPARIARRTGAPMDKVLSWQHMAELSSIKDITPEDAMLLEKSGIHTIDQLVTYDTNKLLKTVRRNQDSTVTTATPITSTTVEHWIAEARDHQFTQNEEQTA